MTREELGEKVARVLAAGMGEQPDDAWKFYANDADAAIAIIRAEVLEEAARVASDGPCGQPEYAWDYWCGYGNGKRAAAAAIRSLKDKP